MGSKVRKWIKEACSKLDLDRIEVHFFCGSANPIAALYHWVESMNSTRSRTKLEQAKAGRGQLTVAYSCGIIRNFLS